jgi:DNA polymerase III delta prime subunit
VQPAGELFTLPPAPDELTDARERQAARTEAEQVLRRKAVAAWLQVPPRYRGTVPELLKRLEHERAGTPGRRLLGKVREAHTVSALLLGPTGCGKSTTAAVLVRRALGEFEASGGKRFECVIDLAWSRATRLAVAERQHALGAGEADPIVRAKRAGLLVLDDVGLEEPGAVLPILADRYDAGLATVVTTGLTKAGLTKHLGAAGVRLLTEQAAGFLLVDAHDPQRARPVNP